MLSGTTRARLDHHEFSTKYSVYIFQNFEFFQSMSLVQLNPTVEIIAASLPNYTKTSETYKLHPLAKLFSISVSRLSDKTLQERILIFIQLALLSKRESDITLINSANILVPVELQRPGQIRYLHRFNSEFNPDAISSNISFQLDPLQSNFNLVSPIGIFDKTVHGNAFDYSFIVTEETLKLIDDGQKLMVFIATDDLGKGVCFANPSNPLKVLEFQKNESLELNSDYIEVCFQLI